MASNRMPRTLDEVLVLAEEMADGLKDNESSVGVLHNTESIIRTALTAVRTGASSALAASVTARNCFIVQRDADTEVKACIGACKKVLTHYLGNQWSPNWAATGFPANSIATPKTVAERQSLVGALREYLAGHPDYEDAKLGVTAVRAAQVFDTLTKARAAANAANAVASQAAGMLDAAKKELRARMSGLIFELGQKLGAEDSRWYAFGLNRPADPSRPGVPEDLTLTVRGPGAVSAAWSATRRAARYRVYVKNAADAEFTPQLSTSEANAIVEVSGAKEPGGSVWIQVSAVNNAGESQPCEPVEIVLEPTVLAGKAA